MSRRYLNWQEDTLTWNSEQRHWEDVYIIISDLLDQSGARNPQEWGDHPLDLLENDAKFNGIKEELQRNLDKASDQYKNKLIEVMILMGNDKISEKKTSRKDIRITVEDIRMIAKQLTVEISDIRE